MSDTPTVQVTLMPQGEQRGFDALISALPRELKCAILEYHLLDTWAPKLISNQAYDHFLPTGGSKDPSLPTSRAMLVKVPFDTYYLQLWRFPRQTTYPKAGHWLIVPLCPGPVEVTTSHVELGLSKREDELWNGMQPSSVEAGPAWDVFRLSRLMGSIARSKFDYPSLRRHFYREMTWTFRKRYRIYDVVEDPNSHLSPEILGSLRSICLEVGNKERLSSKWRGRVRTAGGWDEFLWAFEYLLGLLCRPDTLLPGITSLDLRGQDFPDKLTETRRGWPFILDETVRIRYLVTRCYQLVRARPGIKIVLSGTSKGAPTPISAEEQPRRANGHRERRRGLGYSDEDVLRFSKMIKEVQLPSLEVLDVRTGTLPTGHARWESHFKILFVEEWRKAWELGLQNASNPGGYAGVEDAAATCVSEEVDGDPEETDHEHSCWVDSESEADWVSRGLPWQCWPDERPNGSWSNNEERPRVTEEPDGPVGSEDDQFPSVWEPDHHHEGVWEAGDDDQTGWDADDEEDAP